MILKLAELINDNATYSSYADKYYLQTVDIDCGGETLCIGSGTHPFKGTYVGGDHTIGNFVAGCVDERVPTKWTRRFPPVSKFYS